MIEFIWWFHWSEEVSWSVLVLVTNLIGAEVTERPSRSEFIDSCKGSPWFCTGWRCI